MLREGVEAHDNEQWRQHLALMTKEREDMALLLASERTKHKSIKHKLAARHQQHLQEQRQELTASFRAEIATQRAEINRLKGLEVEWCEWGQQQGVVGGAVPALHVPRDHTTLQAAVDAAQAGERVVLAAGVYNGKVSIRNKQVEIVGVAQGGRVVLECEGNGSAVVVQGAAATVTLSNLTMRQHQWRQHQ